MKFQIIKNILYVTDTCVESGIQNKHENLNKQVSFFLKKK